MSERYDFVFSLGDGCCCSQALRKAGLQKGSLPFDWRGIVGLSRIVQIVADDFRDWSREEDMEIVPDKKTNTPHHYCVNRHNGLVIPHDFPVDMSLHEGFPAVQATYERRISRFRSYAESAKRILAVYVNLPNHPDIPVEEIVRCHDMLTRRFPNAELDLLCYFCQEGHDVADREVQNPVKGVRIVSFDYRYFGKEGMRSSADYDKIALTLADIRARDCRTSAEKRAYAAKLKRERYAALKAKTPWEYFINRIEYKIVRHLGKRLAKKGVKLNL